MNNNFLFRAINHHVAGCGTPPCLDEPPKGSNVFRSYFEHEAGEQWVLTHDAATDAITVLSGDCGWDSELTVKSRKDALANLPKQYADKILDSANALGMLQTPVVCGSKGEVFL